LGGKIDKVYWVLLAAAGSAALFAVGILFNWWNFHVTLAWQSLLNQTLRYVGVLITTLTQIK
jgi:hypothetical protein